MLLKNLVHGELRQRQQRDISLCRQQISRNPNLSNEDLLQSVKDDANQYFKGNFEIQSNPSLRERDLDRDQLLKYFPNSRKVSMVDTTPVMTVVYTLNMRIQSEATKKSIDKMLPSHIDRRNNSLTIYHCDKRINDQDIIEIKDQVKTLKQNYETIVSEIDVELEVYYKYMAEKIDEIIADDKNRRELQNKLSLDD